VYRRVPAAQDGLCDSGSEHTRTLAETVTRYANPVAGVEVDLIRIAVEDMGGGHGERGAVLAQRDASGAAVFGIDRRFTGKEVKRPQRNAVLSDPACGTRPHGCVGNPYKSASPKCRFHNGQCRCPTNRRLMRAPSLTQSCDGQLALRRNPGHLPALL
jgi:hypothetical protein